MLACPYGTFEPGFVRSLAFTLAFDAQHHGRIVHGGSYLQYGTTNIPHGRNQIVRLFLERDEDWLWFVDTDQEWPPETLEALLASADPQERPVMGALVFSYSAGDAQEIKPTLWDFTEDGQLGRHLHPPAEPGIHPVAATGTGCLLIHRSVLEGVRDYTPAGQSRPLGATSWPWFRYGEWDSDQGADVMGEDLMFCLRAGAAGYPIHVDTRIIVDHWKSFRVNFDTYSRQPVREELPHVVVVPVKGKHDLTRSLVDQLLDQGEAAYILILDNGSDADPYTDDRVDVLPCAGMNIHEMWNRGIDDALSQYERCNVAVLNNDLEIGPQFLAGIAYELRADERRLAVSPNYDGRPVGSGFEQVHGICANRYDGTGGLAGFAFMVKGETFREGSPLRFDENLRWWYGDNLFCLAMERVGGVYGIATRTSVVHLDGGSQTAKDADLDDVLAADRAYFEKVMADAGIPV